MKNVLHARAHGALGFGVAGAVGVGGIGKQQQDAALAVVGQGVQIEELVVGGGGIDLEIAGVDDDAERRGDGQGHGADDGVRDVDELDLERADLQDLAPGLTMFSSGSSTSSCSSRRRSTSASVKAVP